MLKDFISNAAKEIEDPTAASQRRDEVPEEAIRINARSVPVELPSAQIYGRARDIFYRARRTHMARAAGIF